MKKVILLLTLIILAPFTSNANSKKGVEKSINKEKINNYSYSKKSEIISYSFAKASKRNYKSLASYSNTALGSRYFIACNEINSAGNQYTVYSVDGVNWFWSTNGDSGTSLRLPDGSSPTVADLMLKCDQLRAEFTM